MSYAHGTECRDRVNVAKLDRRTTVAEAPLSNIVFRLMKIDCIRQVKPYCMAIKLVSFKLNVGDYERPIFRLSFYPILWGLSSLRIEAPILSVT